MARHHEHWYIKRLQKYYNDHYLRYDDEVEWYGNPEPNKWRFRIPSKKWKVSLTCNDKGNTTDEVNQY